MGSFHTSCSNLSYRTPDLVQVVAGPKDEEGDTMVVEGVDGKVARRGDQWEGLACVVQVVLPRRNIVPCQEEAREEYCASRASFLLLLLGYARVDC